MDTNPSSSPTPRKRGRPKGSRNKAPRRPSRRRRQLDVAAVDAAFSAAFGNVGAESSTPGEAQEELQDQPVPPQPIEEDVEFGLQMIIADRDEDEDEESIVEEESNIGFGKEDMYGVNNLLDFTPVGDLNIDKAEGTEQVWINLNMAALQKIPSFLYGVINNVHFIHLRI